jgi:hypothetical protein
MDGEVPRDWDRLEEIGPEATLEPDQPDDNRPEDQLAVLTLVGGAWGDLVSVLAVCTATMVTLAGLGYHDLLTILPWAIALAVLWWGVAGAILLVVRHGTPGMLLAGVAFDGPIPRSRIPWVLLTAFVLSCTLGLPGCLGATRSPLRLTAGVDLIPARARPGEVE